MINSHACVQVPLLLSLGELEGALTKAIDSGDTDLVYLALFRSPRLLALLVFLYTYLLLYILWHVICCCKLYDALAHLSITQSSMLLRYNKRAVLRSKKLRV